MKKNFDGLLLLGVGLMGASLARDLKKKRLVKKIWGYSRTQKSLKKAKSLGVIDAILTDLTQIPDEVDMIVVAVPVSTTLKLMQELSLRVKPHVLVLDMGSTKFSITQLSDRLFPKGNFVPCHPVAGREKSGVAASVQDLFRDRLCVITPGKKTSEMFLKRARQMWANVGARVCVMSAKEHDGLLGASSHFPQILATLLVFTLSRNKILTRLVPFIGSGFRDTTRIAASEPEMWAQIVLENRRVLAPLLTKFRRVLENFENQLKTGNEKNLRMIFQTASSARAGI